MLHRLIAMFAGKSVRIIDDAPLFGMRDGGVCKTIHPVEGSSDRFELELADECFFGSHFELVPETMTDYYVDGKHPTLAGGKRKIELC